MLKLWLNKKLLILLIKTSRNSNLTDAQKQKVVAEIDKALQKALENIDNANDINEINRKLKEGKDNIAKIVAKEITNALIDNKIKEIKARKDLTDEQKLN